MALVKTNDPYFRSSKITHDNVSAADTGVPVEATIFRPQLGANTVKVRGTIDAGSVTIALMEYAGKLSELLDDEIWVEGSSFTIDASEQTSFAYTFTTTGAIVAVFVKSLTTGPVTLEASLGGDGVADK